MLLAGALALLVLFGVWSAWRSGEFASPAAPVPHVQSDCRAACTLEGMALAGVELGAPDGTVRCLCAPITTPGGDL